MIQRRFLGKQVPGAIRSCAPGDFGAVHLAFAGVRQRPIHVAGKRQRVGRLRGLWLVAKQQNLERQVADALLDKLVHAAGVRFEDFARFWVEPRRFLVRGAAEPERAEIFINGKSPGPENFRKLRSEEHTSELQSRLHLVCRLLLEKKKKHITDTGLLLRSRGRTCYRRLMNYYQLRITVTAVMVECEAYDASAVTHRFDCAHSSN